MARLVMPTSVTSAVAGDRVGQLREQAQVLEDGRREDDEVGLGEHAQVVGAHVDGVRALRVLQHVVGVHADDERRRPAPARRERERPADQAEADDADALERRPARATDPAPSLNDRQ